MALIMSLKLFSNITNVAPRGGGGQLAGRSPDVRSGPAAKALATARW